MDKPWKSSGEPELDRTIDGLRVGDNVVWQVELLDDYARFAQAFAARVLADGEPCVYLRFAPHPALLMARPGLEIIRVDPEAGFDAFTAQVHELIRAHGREVAYVFDNLSALVQPWATDELLAAFFQVTCPYLYELDTIAYFALTRGSHAHQAVARIAATTQVMLDVYRVQGRLYVHPLKAWQRYSPEMFLPQEVFPEGWAPILSSHATRDARGPGESIAPWDSVHARLTEYAHRPRDEMAPAPEVDSLKAELRRMLMGDEPRFAALADRFLSLEDLLAIRGRLIGSGRIGGKAAGMLLARAILRGQGDEAEGDASPSDHGGPPLRTWSEVLEDHDSFYLGSDVFFTYLVANGLFRRRLEVQRSPTLTPEQFAELEGRFLTGEFPAAIVARFREMLAHYGETPIIVRSSSLFEDGFGHAFAGKYRSEFCGNQGDLDTRLDTFQQAVKRVYASALSPDALAYRRKQGLLDSDEQMAILVQRVSGERYHDYHFPALAGVAFSRNIYPWADRIDPLQGMVRLVFGLGTRAVDRVEDYPRVIALSHPELRPQVGDEIARYSQHRIDLIDLRTNALSTASLADVLEARDYANLGLYVSQYVDGYVYDGVSSLTEGSFRNHSLVLTFNRLLRRTNIVSVLRAMLSTLEAAYGRPIDTEFTARVAPDGRVVLNLLQCRPMSLPGWTPEALPQSIPPERVLFRASRMAGAGMVRDIRYIVYIDPADYATLGGESVLRAHMGRLVGRLNVHPRLADTPLMMMGPGRWGSSNPNLGVNVSYVDIDHAAVLVEIAREERGYLPEVSFGTHFFQDLIEDGVIYLPLYPDDPATAFQQRFFSEADNILTDLLPDAGAYAAVVKVIDVAAATGGPLAQVAADPGARQAMCYLGV